MGDRGTELRQKVCEAYSAVALEPHREQRFPVGREFAEDLGYPPDLLRGLPRICTEAFTGVSNVSCPAPGTGESGQLRRPVFIRLASI
jgi:hypothetical protein